ncbi:MAG: alpha/beta hydrolase [Opitutae bacterium]|nr:alpha/beta hydrolase [Opitutae bacterium]
MRRLALLFLFGLAAGVPASAAPDSRETVVLLHGVAMRPFIMLRAAAALRSEGYRVVNLGYPSRTMPIEEIARNYLPAQLAAHGIGAAPRVHFVTHSMGSLVLRFYLSENRPANLGRVVLLGPPNHGSAAADYAASRRLLRWVGGINLSALGTGGAAVTRKLPVADFDVGIIAGTRSIHGLFARVLQGENDGTVTVESARLEGMKDFLALPRSHTLMLWRRDVLAQVGAFLRDGKFARPTPAGASSAA